MGTLLKNIQNTVIKYAQVLSQVLKVDVEIMDDQLIRIAGTGALEKQINSSMENESHVYKQVLETGESKIIYRPTQEEICLACPSRLTCKEMLEISIPIKLKNKTIGVIGLVCFTLDQRTHLLKNKKTYMTFLSQIADLVSTKTHEEVQNRDMSAMLNLLQLVSDHVNDAVIIINEEHQIIHMNKKSEMIFGPKDYKKETLILRETGDCLLDTKEYRAKLNGKEYVLVGNLTKITSGDREKSSLFVFSEAKEIRSKIIQLTNAYQTVEKEDMLGNSEKVTQLKKRMGQVANSTSTVLITGESGTGKEIVARTIHSQSPRKDYPFIAINCGAIPEQLLESEFFGYVKGSFTGADPKGKIGKFELASKGTLFLDEIGDMPLYMQVKLLRVLQERQVVRIGSNQSIKIDVRIVAATNKKLEEMVSEGLFREDLYYRLNVIPLEIPPLRERKDDIPLLINHFAGRYAGLFGKEYIGITKEVLSILETHQWLGNVRELENTVEFMVNMMSKDGILDMDTVPKRIRENTNITTRNHDTEFNLRDIERKTIARALNHFGYSTEQKKMAAKQLGIGVATLYRKIEDYKLSK